MPSIFPEPEWESLPDDADAAARKEHEAKRRERFGPYVFEAKARKWSRDLKPRTDIQTAARVIGRRAADLVERERHDRRHGEGGYVLDLRNADLQGCDLSRLDLRKALLQGARLEGADLGEARLEGADLREVQVDGETNFNAARLQSAAVKSSDLSKSTLNQDQVSAMFGDGSLTLPEGIERPEHWPEGDMEWGEFYERWEAWRAELGDAGE